MRKRRAEYRAFACRASVRSGGRDRRRGQMRVRGRLLPATAPSWCPAQTANAALQTSLRLWRREKRVARWHGTTRPGEAELGNTPSRSAAFDRQCENGCPRDRVKPESWCRRTWSIPAPIFQNDVGKNTVAEQGSASRLEIRPLHCFWGRLIFRHNPSDEFVALAEFDGLAGPQPGFEATGVAQLTNVDRWHLCNVTHTCATCQTMWHMYVSRHTPTMHKPDVIVIRCRWEIK